MTGDDIRAALKLAADSQDWIRRLVLHHPDLAARLTQPPLGYTTPDRWNGYIPPFTTSAGRGAERNDSPRRIHLVALAREAIARELGETEAARWLAETNTDHWNHDRTWTPHAALDKERP